MNLMMALGWIGVMLLVGVFLRAKVGCLKKMLVPSCVIGGIIGFILMNTTGLVGGLTAAGTMSELSPGIYSTMVTQLFTISFISIGLTSSKQEGDESSKDVRKRVFKGAMGLGLIWVILYAATAIVGYLCVSVFGKPFGMDGIYGLMIPFGFCQGPGQAASYGTVMESYGWANGAMVGVTFAALGFLFAFLVGVPIAKYGLKHGLAKYGTGLSEAIAKGIIPEKEQNEESGYVTTHSGNIDSLAFHAGIVTMTYILTFFITYLLVKIVPPLGDTLWGMMFMNGMLASYFVKWVMKKFKIEYMQSEGTQRRITGFATDFLIVAAFMSVKLSVIGLWIIPILLTGCVVALLTYVVCFYFGKRIGSENDFERTLGLWGVATGTVPSGIALVRIVDPELKTSTAVELGAMNIPMMLCMETVTIVLMMGAGTMKEGLGLLLLLIPIPICLVLMKIFKVWGKKTFSFKK
ncbi:MAG: sodium/glutamate symporter [Lachnospiraceae bacterium]